MHSAFSRVHHRPWPLPTGRWSWRQSWRDLLFAHWPIPAHRLRHLVPEPLEIQEYGGTSWIGLVPFRMRGVMRRPLPDLPWISAFPELNVRLYVELHGKPGVWFLSLDADNPLAVWGARTFFDLPYFYAKMSVKEEGETLRYSSERRKGAAAFRGCYEPAAPTAEAEPGTLEHFLTERYCLYAADPRGNISRTEVHHAPWPLQPARAEIQENTMFESHGISVSGPPALLHFARRIDVVVWSPEVASVADRGAMP